MISLERLDFLILPLSQTASFVGHVELRELSWPSCRVPPPNRLRARRLGLPGEVTMQLAEAYMRSSEYIAM